MECRRPKKRFSSIFADNAENVACVTVEPCHDRGQLSHDRSSVGERKLGLIVGRHTEFGKQATGEEAVCRARIDEGIDR